MPKILKDFTFEWKKLANEKDSFVNLKKNTKKFIFGKNKDFWTFSASEIDFYH